MTDGTEPTIDTLKANILTEFKQVLKLAPADYTENCTNVVMSLVDEYIADQVAKARLTQLERLYKNGTITKQAWDYESAILEDNIATLNGVKNK